MGEFQNIKFGQADAENEMLYHPDLLLEGYLDANGYIEKLLSSSSCFLVIGPKGSGKSALGSKIALMSKDRDDLFVKQYTLRDFPYQNFDQLIPSKEAPQTRYPVNWEFILRTAVLNSINQDSAATSSIVTLKKTLAVFSKLGLLLDDVDLGNIVKTATKKEFEVNVPHILRIKIEEDGKLKKKKIMETINDGIKKLCGSIKTPNQHIIIIDGLDDVLTSRDKQVLSLSALFLGADRVNKDFQKTGSKIKIVLLCRRDLLDKIKDPNLNKIVTDSGIYLDWYQDVRDVTATNLVKLINHRAKVSLKRDVDVFIEFFPEDFIKDDPSNHTITLKKLLNNTRHSPRDIIQLMNKIQLHVTGNYVTSDNIKNGIRTYSYEYFKNEITDELVGFLTNEEIDLTFELLSSFGKANFTIDEIKVKIDADERFKKLDIRKIFSILYDCNAIGNSSKETTYLSWKYRNRYSSFSPDQIIKIHGGLFKALNLHNNAITYSSDEENYD